MKREIITLKAGESLKDFREKLKNKGYTEINTIYRAGCHVVEYITATLTRQELADAGLIKRP